ncbi:hypothetical protein [Paraburkholderia franconis]|uniref:hypothetical protein n=1 Tax=Paraburkholderia franconis TaxID=2654983 RepID=UPI001D102490|nr:hypothetical protein [Paraburkholderia franconis]
MSACFDGRRLERNFFLGTHRVPIVASSVWDSSINMPTSARRTMSSSAWLIIHSAPSLYLQTLNQRKATIVVRRSIKIELMQKIPIRILNLSVHNVNDATLVYVALACRTVHEIVFHETTFENPERFLRYLCMSF